ncbi:MAG: type I methionyl aminopeptidase [Mitsuaria chitosanitabida]|uniref:type I methionyl aminopeptidase n=1 Tax=Roseateles chitosanitabidus TaxID=65048 RepID=UPI001B15F174|nr:type I methionyl aminopeptidase [Roseateles chitosanitabidus]MBO9688567.1 type I methionyl aminopeptidase [Roseateles chitosanitabidus]
MTIESDDDIQGLKLAGEAVATVLRRMLDAIRPGMTTGELDDLGARWLEEFGAKSAPRVMYDFPGATCISINEQAAHGIPGSRVIQKGDVVNVDVSAELGGYFADTGGTRIVPPTTPTKTQLVFAAQYALEQAMKEVKPGARLNRIGHAIERVAKAHKFKIIENLCSHGVGRSLHEEPKTIPGYYDASDTRILEEGMVITIEPFLSTKSRWVDEESDGWTLSGVKGNLSAQFEHTMIVTRGGPLVVTHPRAQ